MVVVTHEMGFLGGRDRISLWMAWWLRREHGRDLQSSQTPSSKEFLGRFYRRNQESGCFISIILVNDTLQ